MFQARIPDEFAEEIHEYREEQHMSKSEAVRHLLRVGLREETEPDTESEPTHGDISKPLERGYEITKQLSNVSIFLLLMSLGSWVALSTGLVNTTLATAVLTIGLGLSGVFFSLITIFLTLVLEATRKYTQTSVTPELSRLDFRRVVFS